MLSVTEVIEKYKSILFNLGNCPKVGGKNCFGKDGYPNRMFIFYVSERSDVFHTFLRDCGLILKEVCCPQCNEKMALSNASLTSDGMMWTCGTKKDGIKCSFTKSIRATSWFSNSKLTMEEILMLTYEFVNGTSSNKLMAEYSFSAATLDSWKNDIDKSIVDYVKTNSEKIGGSGVTVEIHASNFRKRKLEEQHEIENYWVFGGIEGGSGKSFLVKVQDRTDETLLDVIKQWIKDETVVSSDCWEPYDHLEKASYEDLTVNHKLKFMNSASNGQTHAIETSDCKFNAKVTCNKHDEYLINFARYVYNLKCKIADEDEFLKFLEVVREINWDERRNASSGGEKEV